MRPPKILHVLPADGTGGAEIAARSGLGPDDVLHLHFLQESRGVAAEPNVTGGVGFGSSFSPRAIQAVVAQARRMQPDIIIISLWRSFAAFLALRATCRKARFVLLLHCDRPVSTVDRLLNGIMMRGVTEVWADAEQTLMRRLGPRRSKRGRVISFVTEKAARRRKEAPTAKFVFWGRLTRQKGIDRAIELIAALRERGIDAHYTIAGPDDGEKDALVDQVRRTSMEPFVRFIGPVGRDALPGLAAENTFYLQLSRWEGMAMSIVEAMQLGLIPVVCPVGGVVDYAEDGVNAIVHHTIEDTAARIASVLNDPATIARLQASAIATFADAPTYAESLRAAAIELMDQPR